MVHLLRASCVAALVLLLAAGAAPAAQKRGAARQPVPGEDSFRSATGYAVALMEHCKAINKLARAKGDFNVALAREHGEEVARSAAALSRHDGRFRDSLESEQRALVSDTGSAPVAAIASLADELKQSLAATAPDRKLVSTRATDLFVAAKDYLTAHKLTGKTLKISNATPPRKPGPPKPRKPKGTKAPMAGDTASAGGS